MMLWTPASCPQDKLCLEILQHFKRGRSCRLDLELENRAESNTENWHLAINIIQLQLQNYYCCCAQFLDALIAKFMRTFLETAGPAVYSAYSIRPLLTTKLSRAAVKMLATTRWAANG